MDFKVVSEYQPKGDQPQAIEKLTQGIIDDPFKRFRCNRSGKTFTVANVIQEVQKTNTSFSS
jgi:excinuclease ABC subunit B